MKKFLALLTICLGSFILFSSSNLVFADSLEIRSPINIQPDQEVIVPATREEVVTPSVRREVVTPVDDDVLVVDE